MNGDIYKFRLETEHRGVRFINTFAIHPAMYRSLGPINFCDGSFVAVMADSISPHEAKYLLLEREQIVREVAHRIATGMLDAMSKHDLKNGYPPLPTVPPHNEKAPSKSV